ncbi:MAG: hypothetical protein KZQ96_23310, partial [Candidatus Thiodiazotropha sp. (ex Lucinoma borealis)]|nr:hypothetical protein [Candidatus Thiodiazotropha sp. (ex Lucinoma borealis)]
MIVNLYAYTAVPECVLKQYIVCGYKSNFTMGECIVDIKIFLITYKPQPFSRSDTALAEYAKQHRATVQSLLED